MQRTTSTTRKSKPTVGSATECMRHTQPRICQPPSAPTPRQGDCPRGCPGSSRTSPNTLSNIGLVPKLLPLRERAMLETEHALPSPMHGTSNRHRQGHLWSGRCPKAECTLRHLDLVLARVEQRASRDPACFLRWQTSTRGKLSTRGCHRTPNTLPGE